MSQVIQKYEPGGKTTQPRLYKRGNDDIDLDAYIRDAESEFSYWLANSRLKDKEKQQVQEAYSQMLQGISDGTFTYNIGGGYNNSVGMSNKTKGFDAAGLAAGFLGNILRNQSVYKAPEEKPDPSKIEWKGNSSVGSALVRRLYGSGKESLKDFIDLDLPDPKTKKRGNANRSARFKSGLEYIRDNFDNLFTSFTDSDKATALEGINSALSAFENGTVEDNEYLDLGRATGMSNLRDMFFAGEKYGSTTQAPGTATTPGTGGGTYNNEDEWRTATHPRSTVTDLTNRSLTTTAVYKREGRIKLNSILMNMPKDNLLKLIRTCIRYGPTGQELNKGRSILQGFGQLTSFENNFIIRQALEAARRRNFLHQFPTDQNSYYIPFVSSKLDSRGTGFVYTISPDGNHTLREMDRWDIPFYTTQWHNEFIGQVPSNKNGGRLRKFEPGGKTTGVLKFDPKRNNIYYTGDFASYDNWHANNIVLPWLNAYENARDQDWETLIKSGLDSWNNAGGFDWYNATDEQRRHGMQSAGTQAHQQYVIDNLPGLNTEIAKHIANYNVPARANTNDRFVNGILKGTDTDFGIQTGNRRPSIHINTSGQDLADWDAFYQNLGYAGRYQYLDHWIPTKNTEQDGLVAFAQPEQTDVLAPTTETTPVEEQPEEHSDAWKKVFGTGKDWVGEKFLPPLSVTPKNGSFGTFMSELAPDLIGAGRLWASLHTNNRVYNTVLPSLKPVLKDTYERYSPVTGAFSARQFKNRQGADVMRQSNQAFTSDASLAAARMLEGQRQANQLQAEGFLADDQEIRRTQAEALARQEDNMARRSEVANFDRASINQTNRERAPLEATRLKSNWQSWDNFLQGFESRIRTRADENRERANNFYDKLSANQAEDWYNTAMEPADRAYAAWQKANPGADPTTDWDDGRSWTAYVKHKREARARANAMIYSDMANRYGLHYTNPYTDESNALFNWNRRYI